MNGASVVESDVGSEIVSREGVGSEVLGSSVVSVIEVGVGSDVVLVSEVKSVGLVVPGDATKARRLERCISSQYMTFYDFRNATKRSSLLLRE